MPTLPPFTVFDVETTGLDVKRGERIIEIAALRIEEGITKTESPFLSLVNPEKNIPWEARQIHKITDEEVKAAPTIDIILPKFLEFAAGSTLIAHNATFDMGFLEVEKECCWGYIDLPECFCTMKLSQALFPREFRHNLDAVAIRMGLQIPIPRHRALPDVLLTAQALLKMLDLGKIRSLGELREKAGLKKLTSTSL